MMKVSNTTHWLLPLNLGKDAIILDDNQSLIMSCIYIFFSIQSLPEGLRNYFELLVVLKHDMEVSPDVLATVWDMDNYDTEDCLTRKF